VRRFDRREVPVLVGVALAGLVVGLFACLFAAGGCYHGSPPWPGDPTAPMLAPRDGGAG
jgi:hypothetical protein